MDTTDDVVLDVGEGGECIGELRHLLEFLQFLFTFAVKTCVCPLKVSLESTESIEL